MADPDARVLAGALKHIGENVKGVADIRAAISDKNIDAISVATPNHWHSLITIWGAQAGKHVYVEKTDEPRLRRRPRRSRSTKKNTAS